MADNVSEWAMEAKLQVKPVITKDFFFCVRKDQQMAVEVMTNGIPIESP